jgi:hypothetical protein
MILPKGRIKKDKADRLIILTRLKSTCSSALCINFSGEISKTRAIDCNENPLGIIPDSIL